jgi:hypothetical protein
MKIESLEGKRWFIWAIVLLVVAGVLLTTYIMTSGNDDSYASTIIHQEKEATKKK